MNCDCGNDGCIKNQLATLKAEIVNREGEKQEMREVIDRLKAEVEQYKKAAHEWEMNWAQLKTDLEDRDSSWDRISSELKSELERERIRLAACGAAALGYYEGCKDEYKSASLDDVLGLRNRWLKERERNARLMEALEKIKDDSWYWYKNGFVPAQDEQVRRAILVDRTNTVRTIAVQALQSAAKLDEKGTCVNQDEFKIGDIIRYSSGPTALMRIDHISKNHGIEDRYYGKQCYGSAMGVYRSDAKHASQEDIKTWERENGPAKLDEGNG